MYFSIIVHCITVFSNGHSHIYRINLLITVSYYEGHLVKVRVIVHEGCIGQTHIGCSCIRTACTCHNVRCERKVGSSVQLTVDIIYSITGHCMFFSIIIHRTVVTMQFYRHVYWLNHQLSVHYVEGHVGEVVVRVLEVTGSKGHRICSGIRAAYTRCAIESEVSLCVQRVADSHVIAAHTVQLAIVVNRVAVLGNGYGHIYRINLQLAVHYREGNLIEVRVRVLEVAGQDTHIVCAGCRLGHGPCRCRSSGHGGRHIVQ